MAKHVPAARVVRAAQMLSNTGNPLFADFLILKYYGISPTNEVVLTNTSTLEGIELLMAVRDQQNDPVSAHTPYFNPFDKSNGWRVEDYPRTGPQTNVDGPKISRVSIKSDTIPARVRLKEDYLDLMEDGLLSRKTRNAPRIPLNEIAIWVARADTFDDSADNLTVLSQFISTFHITAEERSAFFVELTSSIDIFSPGPPDLNLLVSGLLHAFPNERRTFSAAGNAVDGDTIAMSSEEESSVGLPDDLLDKARGKLVLPDSTLRQLITLVRMGKNVILTGPPGTGKTTLAINLARVASEDSALPPNERIFDLPLSSGVLATTATADWSTFDTIGGYVPSSTGNALVFREGLFLQAIRHNKWLIVDELNRADVDKAFGQLFSVLSGQAVDLPFRSDPLNEQNLSIARNKNEPESSFMEAECAYVVGSDWRVIATMNTFDRNHLFQLSTAFVRRFAIVNVPVPTASELQSWLEARNLETWVLNRVNLLLAILEEHRPLGPALIEDFIEYVSQRLAGISNAEAMFFPDAEQEDPSPMGLSAEHDGDHEDSERPPNHVSEDPFIEAIVAFILPQLDGLDQASLTSIKVGLNNVIRPGSKFELARHFRDLFNVR